MVRVVRVRVRVRVRNRRVQVARVVLGFWFQSQLLSTVVLQKVQQFVPTVLQLESTGFQIEVVLPVHVLPLSSHLVRHEKQL